MDIYSFGMCVLAMVTGEDPYNECESNSEQIYQLASRGVPPLGLKRIENPQCVDFVESCLKLNPEERLSVEQLFNHPFLQQNEENDDKVVSLGSYLFWLLVLDVLGPASTRNIEELTKNLDEAKPVELIADPNPSQDGNNVSATPPSVDTQSLPPSHSVHISNHVSSETSERISNECPINHPPSSVSVPPTLPTLGERVSPNSSSVQVRVSTVPQGGVVTVELRLGEGDTANGIIQDVEFLFNIEQDNYEVSCVTTSDE